MYEVQSRRKPGKAVLFFALLILSGLMLGFYGCQFFQQAEPVRVDDRVPMDRRIGILKSLGGVRTSNQGTHLLQLDDGNTILLKSLQINLDDPQYIGKSVEVRGLLTYTTDNKQIMEVMNIDLVQQETAVAPEAVTWKDYSSSVLDLQIKYRDDLEIDDKAGSKVVFIRRQDLGDPTQETTQTMDQNVLKHQISIMREKLGEDETLLSKLGVKEDEQAELLAAGLSKSKIGSGNYDALKKVTGNETFYYTEADSHLYTIIIDCGSDENTLSDQNLFYEMLGTLKISGATGAAATDFVSTMEEDSGNDNEESGSAPSADADTSEIAPSSADDDAGLQAGGPGDTQESQEINEGFTTMDSTSFKFSVQYPKSWYYSGSASEEADIIRHYEFGTKPLEEAPGSVSLDLMTGSVPSGSTTAINGKSITTVSSGGTVQIYVKGSGSRFYRISGPAGQEDTLLQIAGSVQD